MSNLNFAWNSMSFAARKMQGHHAALKSKMAETKKKAETSKLPKQLLQIQERSKDVPPSDESKKVPAPKKRNSGKGSVQKGDSQSNNAQGSNSKGSNSQGNHTLGNLAQENCSRGISSFSQEDLKKAVAMSVILGPPASRKRKCHEGYTGRR